MPTSTTISTSRPVRHVRQTLPWLLALAVATCTQDNVGPSHGGTGYFSFQPRYQLAGGASLSQFGIVADTVRIRLTRPVDELVLDTAIAFPADSAELRLALPVELAATPEVLDAVITISAGGVVIFVDSLQVTVTDGPPGSEPPPVVTFDYVGPGSNIGSVVIAPADTTVVLGDTLFFSALAFDSSAAPVVTFYVGWRTTDTSVARINAAGRLISPATRGTVQVIGITPTGIADTTAVVFAPAPVIITADSGSGQAGAAGDSLGALFVARVKGADSLGIAGIAVRVQAMAPGAAVRDTLLFTDLNGRVRTRGLLGTAAGAQTFEASVVGAALPAAVFTATATAAAPAAIAIQGGNAQTDTVTQALPLPFVVRVADAFDNAVPGAKVYWSTTVGGGSAAFDSTFTDGAGLAQVAYTLGATAGTDSITAALAGTSAFVMFNATGISATPTQIIEGLGAGQSAVAGTAFTDSLTVQILDANDNPVADVWVHWTVVSGSVAVSADSTLTDLAGHTGIALTAGTVSGAAQVDASVAGIVTPVSFLETITPGAAASLTVSSGAGQTAPAGTALPLPVVVRVADAFNNPVPGTTVAFAAVTGGGTVDSATATTDATGLASSGVWTLGLAGLNTLRATSAAVPADTLLVDATATPAGTSKTWTAAVDNDWATAGNWSPSGVPAASDNVFVPAAPSSPVVSAAAAVNDLITESGSTVTLGTITFTIAGNADIQGVVTGTGTVDLTGAATTFRGTTNTALVLVNGTPVLNGPTTITGPLTLNGGTLTVGGQALAVSGALTVQGNAQLVMTNAADSVDVGGALTYSSGTSGAGVLTAGALVVRGNVTQTAGAFDNFVASGTHTLRLAGGGAQTMSFSSPAATQSRLGNVDFANSSGVTLTSNVFIDGSTSVTAGTVTGAGRTVTLSGALATPYAAWQVSTTAFAAAPAAYPDSLPRSVSLQAAWTLTKPFHVDSAFTITAAGTLGLGGQAMRIGGALVNGGRLVMTSPADSLDIGGAFSVNSGNSGAGDLTAGVLIARGNFTQTAGAFDNFQATGTHRTRFLGAALQTVNFSSTSAANSHFADVEFGNPAGITLATNIVAAGATSVTAGTVTGTGRTAFLAGDLATATTAWQVTTTEFSAAPANYPDSLPLNVNVTAPWTLTKPFAVLGTLTLTSLGDLVVGGQTLRVGGGLTVSGSALLVMNDPADSVDVGGNAAFSTGTSSAGALTDGVLVLRGNLTQTAGAFDNFAATAAHRTRFAGTGVQIINFSSPSLTNSRLRHAEFANAAGVTLGTSIVALGNVTVSAGTVTGVARTAFLGGDLATSHAAWQVSTTQWSAAPAVYPDSLPRNVTLTAPWLLTKGFKVDSTLTISSTGALTVNGFALRVGRALTQSGVLIMQNAADTVDVGGLFTVNSGSSGAGALSAGLLRLRGGLAQTAGAFDNFQPSGTHVTRFEAAAGQAVNFSSASAANSRFQELEVADSVNVTSPAYVAGNVTLLAGGKVQSIGTATLAGDLVDPTNAGWRYATTQIAGTPTTLPDTMVTNLVIQGNWIPQVATTITGSLTITSTGQVDLGGRRVNVSGATIQTGRLLMLQPQDTLDVGGTFTVNSGTSGAGDLVDGHLVLRGGFVQTAGAFDNFAPTTSHTTVFFGSGGHTLSFSSGGLTNSRFHHLKVSDSLTVTGTFAVTGDATLATPGRMVGAGTARLAGALVDPSFLGWRMATTELHGRFQTIPASLTTDLVLLDTIALAGPTTVTGNFTMQGNGYVAFAGHGLGVSGDFTQNAHLGMNSTQDSLEVGGNFLVNSGSDGTGQLTAGVIVLHGGFTQTAGSFTNFVAAVPHRVRFTGGAARTISISTPTQTLFGDLDIDATGAITLANDVRALGLLKVPGVPATLTAPAQRLLRTGGLAVDGLTLDRVRVLMNSPAVNAAQCDTVTFAYIEPALTQLSLELPGLAGDTLKFTNVAFSGTPTTGRYLYVADSAANGAPATIGFYNSTPLNGALFTAVEGSVGDTATVLWTHLDWITQPSDGTELVALSPSPQAGAFDPSGALVTSYTGTVTLGFLANPGGATLAGNSVAAVGGIATFDSLTLSLAGTGYRLEATSAELGASPPSSLFNISIPFPAGTTTAFNNGGGDNDWFNAANWTAGVPDSTDNVFVFPSVTATVNAPARANRVEVGTGGGIVLNAALTVDSSVTAGNTISGGGQLIAQGSGTLTGTVGDLVITGSYRVGAGNVLAAQTIAVSGGSLHLNGGRVDVTADFTTTAAGVLQMTDPADSLMVGGNFTAAGGATDGLLTAGLLQIAGGFTQSLAGAANSFRADSGHTTRFTGGIGFRTIDFGSPVEPADPLSTANSRFGRLELVDGVDSLAATTPAAEDLVVATAQVLNTLAGSGGPAVGGNVTVQATAAGFSPQDLSLAGTLDFQLPPASYQVGSTLFFGNGQTIPVLPYGNLHVAVGTATLGGDITTTGEVRAGILGIPGTLDIGGHVLTVGGSLIAVGLGTFTIDSAADSVDVAGPVDLGGAPNTGFTAGVLVARGDFYMRDSVYVASGTHRTVFANASPAQLRNLGPEVNENRFNKLVVATGSTVNFNPTSNGAITVLDTFRVSGFFLQATPGQKVIALGDLYIGTSVSFVVDTAELHRSLNVDASVYNVELTRYAGIGQIITPSAPYADVEVTGAAALDSNVAVGRDAFVSATGTLDLAGHELAVTRNFRTRDSGVVMMTAPLSTLLADTAEFAGGNTSGLLSAGTLRTRVLIQSNVTSDFSYTATGTHLTQIGSGLGGPEYRIQMATGGGGASQLQDLLLDDGGQVIVPTRVVGRVRVAGKLRTTPQGSAGVIGAPGAFLAVLDSLIINDASTAITLDTLEVHGGFAVQTNTLAAGVVRFAGLGQAIPDTQNYQRVEVTGTVGLESTATAAGFTVRGNGQFTMTGFQQLLVSGDFATAENGRLEMTGSAPDLFVGGNATFAGGSSIGLLTSGTIRLAGNFTELPGTSIETFTTTNTGVTFQGGSGVQVVTIDPAATGNFRGVGITNPSGIQINGLMVVTDSVSTVAAITGDSLYQFGSFFFGGAGSATVGLKVLKTSGLFVGTPATYAVGRTHITNANPIPAVAFDTLVINAPGATLFSPLSANELIVAGVGSPFGNGSASAFELDLGGSRRGLVSGNVVVEGSGATLRIGDDTLVVGTDFITRSGGRLILNNAAGSLEVSGNVVVRGPGTGIIANNAAHLSATGNLTVDQGGYLFADGTFVGPTFAINGDVLIDGASTADSLIRGTLTIGGNFTQLATTSAASWAPDSTFMTVFTSAGTQAVSFATPSAGGGGGSQFGLLQLNAGTLQLGSDVFAGTFVGNGGTLTSNDQQFTATKDLQVDGVVFDHTRMIYDAPISPFFFDNNSFINMNPTLPQLKVNFAGSGTVFFNNLNFDDAGALFVEATSFFGSPFILDVGGPDQATGPGKTSTPGGQVTVNWGP